MCTVLLPPGVNPIAANKYININPNASSLRSSHSAPVKLHKRFHTLFVVIKKMFTLVFVFITLNIPGRRSHNISTHLTFRGSYTAIYSYNKSQQVAVFLDFILVRNSTCFGQTYCPSPGVLTLYSQQKVFVILVTLTVC